MCKYAMTRGDAEGCSRRTRMLRMMIPCVHIWQFEIMVVKYYYENHYGESCLEKNTSSVIYY